MKTARFPYGDKMTNFKIYISYDVCTKCIFGVDFLDIAKELSNDHKITKISIRIDDPVQSIIIEWRILSYDSPLVIKDINVDDSIVPREILRHWHSQISLLNDYISSSAKSQMSLEIALDLFDNANIAGFCSHRLADMIRKGATEKKCLEDINKAPRTINSFQSFPRS